MLTIYTLKSNFIIENHNKKMYNMCSPVIISRCFSRETPFHSKWSVKSIDVDNSVFYYSKLETALEIFAYHRRMVGSLL